MATLVAALVAVILLSLLALQIRDGERDSRRSLEERQRQRAALAQQFVVDYIADLSASIRRHGEVTLGTATPTEQSFREVVRSLQGTTARLLDSDGRVLHATPRGDGPAAASTVPYPGVDRAFEENLDTVALLTRRRGSVSPVLGFVVPFESPFGRRVLAIGIPSNDTSLRSFFRNLSPLQGQRWFLVDDAGTIIATNFDTTAPTLTVAMPDLARAVEERPTGRFRLDGEGRYFTSQEFPAVAWRVVSVVPEHSLYAPVEENRSSPWMLFLIFVLVAALGVAVLRRVLQERSLAAHSALVDNLTGIANRRQLELEFAAMAAGPKPWGVFLVDIDHFKAVNDRYGHPVGDEVLRTVATTLRANSRPGDVVGRWGGEEFLVIVRNAGDELSATLAERLRAAIADLDGLESGPVTVSVGYATTESAEPDRLLGLADEALYVAKHAGRNRVATVRQDGNDASPLAGQFT